MTDTIFAVSSGRPPAAIAVIRISGPHAIAAAAAIAGRLPAPRQAGLRRLRDAGGRVLDRALVLVLPGPATATGEDLVEFHCHGGRAVVAAVETAIGAMAGCRRAEPGEFTRRALIHGRIDLTEAEGLADLLEAETEAQRVAAMSAVEGRVSQQVTIWLREVAGLSARVEAMLDYADEDDVAGDEAAVDAIRAAARDLGLRIAAVAAMPPVERLRDGVRVVIGGPPNAGKSTLINLMAERDVAIVSPVAGTTRDRIEAPVVRDGMAYVLSDTAGLTQTDDVIEAIGVDLADAALKAADIVIWLGDDAPPRVDALWIQSRSDVPDRTRLREGRVLGIRHDDAATIDALWNLVGTAARALLPRADQLPLRARHRELCRSSADALCDVSTDPLLLAETLRLVRGELAGIVGVDSTEAMLDALFSRFCIGK